MQEIIITAIVCLTIIVVCLIWAYNSRDTKEHQCLCDINATIATFERMYKQYNSETHEFEVMPTLKESITLMHSISEMIHSLE